MSRELLGLFHGDEDPEDVAAAIMNALQLINNGAVMNSDGSDSADLDSDDEGSPTRLDPDGGDPSLDPDSYEGLLQAQEDRLAIMAVMGMSEDDFGPETIWLVDDDGDLIRREGSEDDDHSP